MVSWPGFWRTGQLDMIRISNCFCALTVVLCFLFTGVFGQEKPALKDSVAPVDVHDLFNMAFRKNKKPDSTAKKNGSFSLLPTIGYTPSVGFLVGADLVASKYLGKPETTSLSVFEAYAAWSTKKTALVQLKHNMYTADNKFNLQGSWEVGKNLLLDHGIGTGHDDPGSFPIKFTYLKLSEYIYRKILPNIYAGAGLAFNYYTDIDDEKKNPQMSKTFNHNYSIRNGYSPEGYFANGLLFNLQYNTRDQPYRPYKGIYANIVLRTNQKWLGSDKEAVQLKTEFRKYWGLSAKNPEHVLAFWSWGSYLIDGSVPYLDLPGTGGDVDQRSGRGYTIGRFKGPSFFYNELEYRFPITRNKLISGVAFVNGESASNQRGTKLFQYWEPGGGAGIRILFNKHTRSNLCIDYGIGNFASNAIFVGLNEVF